MPIQETFWAQRFGMLVDRFGVPWIINCEAADWGRARRRGRHDAAAPHLTICSICDWGRRARRAHEVHVVDHEDDGARGEDGRAHARLRRLCGDDEEAGITSGERCARSTDDAPRASPTVKPWWSTVPTLRP
jgi:hypothetical protein